VNRSTACARSRRIAGARGGQAGRVAIALLLAGACALAPLPAVAQFYWPWQTRPAPPPPPPPQPAPRATPRQAVPRPQVTRPSSPKPEEKKTDKVETPPPEPPPPPYEPQLLRLSEILGALSFLRPLCGNSDGGTFLERMTILLDAEAQTENRRERLAGAYNKGFREYQQVYRRCTPAAQLIITRYADEGGKLTRELTGRFGG
jgi:uncharacterized protein (TIGR02301 family)